MKGASKGEGLGNQFLGNIREVDVIMFVLRAFTSDKVVHVYERVNPVEDLEIVLSELILKDIESVDKRISSIARQAKNNKELAIEHEMLVRLMAHLEEGKPVNLFSRNEDEAPILRHLFLLTDKKFSYVLNVKKGVDDGAQAEALKAFYDFIDPADHKFVLEIDIKELTDYVALSDDEKAEYVEMIGEEFTGIDRVIKLGFERLDLLTFYTGSEKECNAWAVTAGATVQESAGVIHTDLAKGFITAEVVNVDDLVESGGVAGAKEKGVFRIQGKEYLTQDGDYILVNSSL